MLALLLSSLSSLFLFIVFGTVVVKVSRLQASIIETLLLGLVVSNTLTAYLSIILPINTFVLLALLLLCLILAFVVRKELANIFTYATGNKEILWMALPFIAIAFLVSLNAPANYDSGLYHIQSIEWIETYKAIPGLANLHGRFGFNPNIFTFFALTSLSGIFGQAIFSVNFTMFSIFAVYYVSVSCRTYKQKGINGLLLFYLIAFVTLLMLYENLSSPTPDFLSISLPLFIMVRAVDLSANQLSLKGFIPLITLSVYILTTKLAAVPLMLMVAGVCWYYRAEARKLPALAIVMILMVLPWFVRNVILSGWLVYPFPSLNLFHFDWQVPIERVIIEKETVTGWARSPSAHYAEAARMNFMQWFPIWWKELKAYGKFLFLAGLCFPLLTIAVQAVKKTNIWSVKNLVVLTAFAGVIFWLFLAPEFRFGQAFIIVSAASPLLLIGTKNNPTRNLSGFVVIMLILVIGQLYVSRSFVMGMIRQTNTVFIRPKLIQSPVKLSFKTFKIKGITIYAPANSDKCFCHAVPCVPHVDTTITSRGITITEGFKMKQK